MSKKEAALKAILDQGMLPLFYYADVEVSMEIIRSLYKAGVRVLEYTNRGAKALENFAILKQKLKIEAPDLYLGIGTIKSKEDAEAFLKIGADFLVSPIVNPEVAAVANANDLLWVPGCMTPTEIYTAQQNKAALIKLFPANIIGQEFMSSIKELFQGQLFIPTGGVDTTKENISAWLKSGVCAVGMGSKLISKAVLENKAYAELETETKKVLEVIKSCK